MIDGATTLCLGTVTVCNTFRMTGGFAWSAVLAFFFGAKKDMVISYKRTAEALIVGRLERHRIRATNRCTRKRRYFYRVKRNVDHLVYGYLIKQLHKTHRLRRSFTRMRILPDLIRTHFATSASFEPQYRRIVDGMESLVSTLLTTTLAPLFSVDL